MRGAPFHRVASQPLFLGFSALSSYFHSTNGVNACITYYILLSLTHYEMENIF